MQANPFFLLFACDVLPQPAPIVVAFRMNGRQVLPLTPYRPNGIRLFLVNTVSAALTPDERLFHNLEINSERLLVSLVPALSLLLTV